jgi:uncharacterized protein YheU (UPF0270 family)
MIIPHQQLDKETLNNLLEAYVLQEGTDYGEQEITLEQKVADVRTSLTNGKVVLVYSELHETVNVMAKEQFESQQYQEQERQEQESHDQ